MIEDPEGRVVARLSEYLGRQTNNYAEYKGLLSVLEWALANGAKRLRVVSDSELMVRQMKGRYRVKSELYNVSLTVPCREDCPFLTLYADAADHGETSRWYGSEGEVATGLSLEQMKRTIFEDVI